MLTPDRARIDTMPGMAALGRRRLEQAEAQRLQALVAMLDRARGYAIRPRAHLASRDA